MLFIYSAKLNYLTVHHVFSFSIGMLPGRLAPPRFDLHIYILCKEHNFVFFIDMDFTKLTY